MKKTKTFLTTLSGIVPIWICTALGIIFIAFMGCEDATTMMKPVVSKEPADTTPPTTVGEVKDPAVLDEPPEPTPPADMTPPTVVEVAWYSNWQLTQPITDDVQPGNTIYTVVVFSEPMLHAVADNASARPALSIVIDGMATPYRMLTHGVTFQSGEAKPNKSGTDDFVCKYTIPADTSGTIACVSVAQPLTSLAIPLLTIRNMLRRLWWQSRNQPSRCHLVMNYQQNSFQQSRRCCLQTSKH